MELTLTLGYSCLLCVVVTLSTRVFPFYSLLYRCNVVLPLGISQIYGKVWPSLRTWVTKWPCSFSLTNIALFLPPLSWSPHLQIVSGLPLTQVQLPFSLTKPMYHPPSVLLWISFLIKSHSSSVSMEIKSPPRFSKMLLLLSHGWSARLKL